MEDLTISQIAKRAGIRTSTIRYYESIELLPEARRVSGQRRYEASILERLSFIRVAQGLGFSLTEIQRLFQNREEETPLSERWQQLAHQKLDEVEILMRRAGEIQHMLVQGLRCGCQNLSDCIQCLVAQCDGGVCP